MRDPEVGEEAGDAETSVRVVSSDPLVLLVTRADSTVGFTNTFKVGQRLEMRLVRHNVGWVTSGRDDPWYVMSRGADGTLTFGHYR